jgi:hypothetical protein
VTRAPCALGHIKSSLFLDPKSIIHRTNVGR